MIDWQPKAANVRRWQRCCVTIIKWCLTLIIAERCRCFLLKYVGGSEIWIEPVVVYPCYVRQPSLCHRILLRNVPLKITSAAPTAESYRSAHAICSSTYDGTMSPYPEVPHMVLKWRLTAHHTPPRGFVITLISLKCSFHLAPIISVITRLQCIFISGPWQVCTPLALTEQNKH